MVACWSLCFGPMKVWGVMSENRDQRLPWPVDLLSLSRLQGSILQPETLELKVMFKLFKTYYLSFTQQLSSLVHVTKSDFSYSVFAMGLVPGQGEHLHGSPGMRRSSNEDWYTLTEKRLLRKRIVICTVKKLGLVMFISVLFHQKNVSPCFIQYSLV